MIMNRLSKEVIIKISILLLTIITCSFLLGTTTNAANINIIVNGTTLKTDVSPVMENQRVLVPFRSCGEALGATISYNDANRSITMQKADLTVTMIAGSSLAYANQNVINLGQPLKSINGRVMVPIRFISEIFGAEVEWQSASSTVVINLGSGTEPPKEDNPAPAPEQPEQKPSTPEPQPTPGQTEKEQIDSILNKLNYLRGQKNLADLTVSIEAKAMADSHASDMANNNFLSHISPTKGNTQKRATNFNLPVISENIAKVDLATDSNITGAVDAWVRNATARANILHPSAHYVGIGIKADPNKSGAYYITANFILSDSYFTNKLFETTSTGKITLNGYSLAKSPQITIYRLSSTNNNIYVDKQSVAIEITDGKFTKEFKLWVKGTYLAQINSSIIKIQYK